MEALTKSNGSNPSRLGPNLVIFMQIRAPFRTYISWLRKVDNCPEKIRFFEPFWISRVFHFFLGTFGKVEAHPGPLVASDEIYTQSKFDISGSNETMQNALASIV